MTTTMETDEAADANTRVVVKVAPIINATSNPNDASAETDAEEANVQTSSWSS